MLQNPGWQKIDHVVRAQFALFDEAASDRGLSVAERRARVGLDVDGWMGWTEFAKGGALPAAPSIPEMLIRLGAAAYELAADEGAQLAA